MLTATTQADNRTMHTPTVSVNEEQKGAVIAEDKSQYLRCDGGVVRFDLIQRGHRRRLRGGA